MKEYESLFNNLIEEAEKNEDPEGSVAACLVKNGKVIAISPSAQDGVRHAEDLVLEIARRQGIQIDNNVTLLTTLEPCSYRSPRNKVDDCTTIILASGIKKVIYGAKDPNFSTKTAQRFKNAGVVFEQITDPELIQRSIDTFNGSITKTKTIFGDERKLRNI